MKSSASYLFRISCCAALVAFLATPAWAASLSGTVTYKTGPMAKSALASALVSVYHTTTGRKAVTRSNNLGLYLIRNIPAGPYVILVEKDGRRIYQGRVQVREPETRFDIGL